MFYPTVKIVYDEIEIIVYHDYRLRSLVAVYGFVWLMFVAAVTFYLVISEVV